MKIHIIKKSFVKIIKQKKLYQRKKLLKKKKKIIYIYALKVLSFFFSILTCFFSYYFYNEEKMKYEISSKFGKFNKININNIYNKYHYTRNNKKKIIKNTIHIEFTLDPNFVLETMLTVASIMATQNNTTKIVFHFGVTGNFTAEKMLKMFSLKNKINNLTEFNFYYLKGAIQKMRGFHPKGAACPGKFELPQLLPDNIEKILLFDAGDLLIFKDLTELYNYDMKNFWVLGLPEPLGIYLLRKKRYRINKQLNIGSLLINVTKFKINNLWDKYTRYRYRPLRGQRDQSLLNIVIPDDKKDYFPFTFGVYSIYKYDWSYAKNIYYRAGLKGWLASKSNHLPENPRTIPQYYALYKNATFIHQFEGKWFYGQGLSRCRNSAKYFIKLAGIWEELCKKRPGYCK